MPLEIRVEAELAEADETCFRQDAATVWDALDGIRAGRGIGVSEVRAVLADDFAAAVERYFVPPPGQAVKPGWYGTDRLGSQPVGKNMNQVEDGSEVVVVFAANRWRDAATEVAVRIVGISAIAHEFAHVLINRARHASGAMEGVIIPSVTGHEAARSLARILGDEYRADCIAESVVAAVAAADDGSPTDGLLWSLGPEDYLEATKRALDAMHPGWPDLVNAYRRHEMSLEDMWGRFRVSFEIALTNLVHVQSAADAKVGEVLDLPDFSAHPAVKLYLGPFREYLDAVRSYPAIVSQADVRAMEERLVSAGEAACLEMWRRLGLRPEDRRGRSWALWVDEPSR